ncbi:MAG TPA: DUF2167 domain-containing protein [Nannocystaceae bacterium]|nr:DUF2167 domain-containing protein [Nannocystaceae bacterium]
MKRIAPTLALALCSLVAIDADAKKPKRAPEPAPTVEAPVIAPGSVEEAAQKDASLTAMLASLPEEQRARIAAMPIIAFDAAMQKDEHSQTFTEEELQELVFPVATIGLLARWNPEMADTLASIRAELRDEVSRTTTRHLDAIANVPREDLAPEDRRILEALDAGFAKASMKDIVMSHGDVAIGDALATLHLGDDYELIGAEDALHILVDKWGNPRPANAPLGMIVPRGMSPLAPDAWAVIVTYVAEGHVEDDDAEDIDYDELMQEMKAADAEDNAERRRLGLEELTMVGWAASPRYDATHHRLYWACELVAGTSKARVLNYDVRVLGRKGVLSLNAVGSMDQLAPIGTTMEHLLAAVEMQQGSRYEDFDPDLDEVAAYGIGGLVAGKLAMKAGIFAGLLKVLIAAKKAVILAVVAIGAGVASWLKKRRG